MKKVLVLGLFLVGGLFATNANSSEMEETPRDCHAYACKVLEQHEDTEDTSE